MPTVTRSPVRYADLPLHYGKVPTWLYERMGLLGGAIIESVVAEYGRSEALAPVPAKLYLVGNKI
jgi:uncharacterized protein